MTAFERIDAWLEAHAPDVLAALRPGATESEIAAAESTLGRALSSSLRQSYRAHDGAKDDRRAIFGGVRAPDWIRYMWWLPIRAALDQRRFMQSLAEDWPEDHLPIAKDAGGNLLLADLRTAAILSWDHETWEPEPVAASFEAWMTALADDMDAGLVVTDEEDDEPDALRLLAAPPPASAKPPSLEPDRPARVLLAALLERRWVDVDRAGDVDGLLRALVVALSAPPKARARKVSDVLEKSACVEELFADDEQIAKLVEELG